MKTIRRSIVWQEKTKFFRLVFGGIFDLKKTLLTPCLTFRIDQLRHLCFYRHYNLKSTDIFYRKLHPFLASNEYFHIRNNVPTKIINSY